MKKIIVLVSMVLCIIGTPFAQEKSNTKSTLTDGYKQLLLSSIEAIKRGNINLDQYASEKIDSLLRVCYLADAEKIFLSISANIAEGKIERPKLDFEKIEGKSILSNKTIEAYKKSFQSFMKGLPMGVQKTDYDKFVKNNKNINKPKTLLIKEFKNHLTKILLNVK